MKARLNPNLPDNGHRAYTIDGSTILEVSVTVDLTDAQWADLKDWTVDGVPVLVAEGSSAPDAGAGKIAPAGKIKAPDKGAVEEKEEG